MDLGFGSSNQIIGNAAANAVLQAHRVQEQAIDQEISKYDALLNANDDELEALRARRLKNMKKQHEQQQLWKSLGHGKYESLEGSDTAKEFFESAKKSECMVVHFYRKTTRLCDVFHKHLEKIASKHLECKFVCIDVENSNQGVTYLTEKLGIVIMPTLVLVKNRNSIHHIRGFDELGDTEDFRTEVLEYVLGAHGVINRNEDIDIPEELVGDDFNSTRISRVKKNVYDDFDD